MNDKMMNVTKTGRCRVNVICILYNKNSQQVASCSSCASIHSVEPIEDHHSFDQIDSHAAVPILVLAYTPKHRLTGYYSRSIRIRSLYRHIIRSQVIHPLGSRPPANNLLESRQSDIALSSDENIRLLLTCRVRCDS